MQTTLVQEWWQDWEPPDPQALLEKAAGFFRHSASLFRQSAGLIKQWQEAGWKLASKHLSNLPETLAAQANALSVLLQTLAAKAAKVLPEVLEALSGQAETLRVSGVSNVMALSAAAREAWGTVAPRSWASIVGTGPVGLAWVHQGLQALFSTIVNAIQVHSRPPSLPPARPPLVLMFVRASGRKGKLSTCCNYSWGHDDGLQPVGRILGTP